MSDRRGLPSNMKHSIHIVGLSFQGLSQIGESAHFDRLEVGRQQTFLAFSFCGFPK